MAEQTFDPVTVEFRCDRCLRRRGRPPLLAEVSRSADGTWEVSVAIRGGRRIDLPLAYHDPRRGEVELIDAPSNPIEPRVVLVPVGSSPSPNVFASRKSVQLDCRRCSNRPRLAGWELLELASQAVAGGRRDAYV